MSEIGKIVALLEDPSAEKQIAAAIVLGEIRAKGAEIAEALIACAENGPPAVQKHALEALAKIGAKRIASRIFPLLTSPADDVRRAATLALISVGEEIVPLIRQRMSSAEDREKRALDSVLAELGGKDAFGALLAGLASSDGETAKAAALSVRQQVKGADAKQRRSYLAAVERFLKHQKKDAPPSTIAAAIKILGYLEDEKAIEPLLEWAGDESRPAFVRQEAIIALRFAIGKAEHVAGVARVLIDAAAAEDRTLAQTALHTLGGIELAGPDARRLEKLLDHPEIDRSRFVIEQLGRQGGSDAAKMLVEAAAKLEKRRADLAIAQLQNREEAAPFLARALLECEEADRAWMIRRVLQKYAKKIAPALKKQLLQEAMERIPDHRPGWEALLEIARQADPESTAEALRELISKLKRQKKQDKLLPALTLLAKSESAAPEDVFALASLELAKSAKDVRPSARSSDEALRLIGGLSDRGFDVLGALKKDKSLGLEELYYVGFHFVEEGHPLGADVLEEVVKRGGRTKIAKMAKNKRSLALA
jgi:HEAT repeat protein